MSDSVHSYVNVPFLKLTFFSDKLGKLWQSIMSFTTATTASTDQPATPAMRRCEAVVDLDDNDVPYQDIVVLASTPAHDLKTCRAKRTANNIAFLPNIEYSIEIEKEAAPDVLNESTGFALSPIVARNNKSSCSFLERNPVKYVDRVIEEHILDDNSIDNTYTGYNTCYSIDVVSEYDTCDLSKDVEMETVEAYYAKTLDKEYTAGDIADILDSTKESVSDCEANQRNQNASNGKMSYSTVNESDNTIASINQTQPFDGSDTLLQFMNVDFSIESIDNNNISKINSVSEESVWVNIDIIDETLLIRSPLRRTSYTCNDNITNDTDIGKSNSFPYMTRKQRPNNVYSVSDLKHKYATAKINKTYDKESQSVSHPTKLCDYSSEQSSSATCWTISIDMDKPASSNTSVVSDIPEVLCDIDDLMLTVTSEATRENESIAHISGIVDGTSELIRTPASNSAQVGSICDVDQFTLINTREMSTNYVHTNVEGTQEQAESNVTGTNEKSRENNFDPRRNGESTSSRPRRDILRRDSFIEAISNTITESDLTNYRSKKRESGVTLDFETEGSHFNYGYEIDSDSRSNSDTSRKLYTSEEDAKTCTVTNEESKINVNAIAYF